MWYRIAAFLRLLLFKLTVLAGLFGGIVASSLAQTLQVPASWRSDFEIDYVIQDSKTYIEVNSNAFFTYDNVTVYAVLNKEGYEDLKFQAVSTYNYSELLEFEIEVLDSLGGSIEKLRGRDFEEFENVRSSSTELQSDRNVTAALYETDVFPHLLVVHQRINFRTGFILQFYDFTTSRSPKHGTLRSDFEVRVNDDVDFEYFLGNGMPEPTTSVDNNFRIYRWHLGEQPPYVNNIFIDEKEFEPYLFIKANRFTLENYQADFSTWAGVGQFYNALSEGRGELPPSEIATAKELVAGLTTDREKAVKLYRYMQDRTRYISISLGIGGWQPMPASFVCDKGYGECKALSNYLQALLKAVGVTSYPVLVRSGERQAPLEVDFPSSQFNHVFLAVPSQGDTLWLECTNSLSPPNYSGNFTGNRKGLLVLPEGGKLINLNQVTAEENLQHRTITLSLTEQRPSVDIGSTVTGTQAGFFRGLLGYVQANDQPRRFASYHQMPAPEEMEFSYSGFDERADTLRFVFHGQDRSLVRSVANRFLVSTYFFSANLGKIEDTLDLDRPFTLWPNFHDIDEVVVQLPEGYKLRKMPENIELEYPFGSMRYTFYYDETKRELYYEREVLFRQSRIDPNQFSAFKEFVNTIYEYDTHKLVFVGGT